MGQALPQVPCTLHQSVFLGALRQGRSLRIHFQESWQPRTLRHRFFIFDWPRRAEHPIAVAYQKRSAVNRVFRGNWHDGPNFDRWDRAGLASKGPRPVSPAGRNDCGQGRGELRERGPPDRFYRAPAGLRTVGCAASGYNRADPLLPGQFLRLSCRSIQNGSEKRTVSCIQGIIDNRMMTMAVSPIVPGDGPGRSPAGSTSVWRLGLRLRHINPPVFGRDGPRSWLGRSRQTLHISRRPTPLRSSSNIQGEVGEARRSSGATRRRASSP